MRGCSRVLLFTALVLIASLAVAAGPPEPRPLRIALVKSRDLPPYQLAAEGYQATLTTAGFQPDVTLFDLQGEAGTAEAIVAALRRSPPDQILTLGTLATREIAQRIDGTPIVFAMVLEPGSSGLVSSGHTSGRNLTGVSMDITPVQQIDAIRTVLPDARRIGALYSPSESTHTIAQAIEAAKARGLTFIADPVTSERDVPRALSALSARVDVLMAVPDATVYTSSSTRYILLHTLRQAQPFMGLLESFVKAGALMGLALDYADLGRQAGELAVRIARGDAPGQLPVIDPRETTLILNLRTARRIGVKVPAGVLERAEVLVP